jgi:hypothetical protein
MSAVNRMSSMQMPHGIGVFASPRFGSCSTATEIKQPHSGSRTGTQSRLEAGSAGVCPFRQADMDAFTPMLAFFVARNTAIRLSVPA